MSSALPGALDAFSTTHGSGDQQSVDHATVHNDLADAVNTLEQMHSFVASYVIRQTGTDYEATSPIGLPYVAPDADAGAVFQSCMDNINSSTTPRGTIVFAPDTTFTWATVPMLLRTYASGGSDDKGWLRILGSGGSVIQLTSTARTFLGLTLPTTDYDGFCGVEIGHLEFDDQNLSSTDSGNVITGTRLTGVSSSFSRCDFRRWWFHDLQAYNVASPGRSTNNRAFIWFSLTHPAASEATQNQMTDFLVERCKFIGGDAGFVLTGSAISGGSAGLNIWGDNIIVRDFHWDSDTVCDSVNQSSGIQIGSGMFGERMTVERCYLAGSGDDGIEVNNFRTITVRDTTIERCYGNGFEPVMFNYVNGVDNTEAHTQTILFENCTYNLAADAGAGTVAGEHAYGIFLAGTAGIDLGTLTFRNCKTRCASKITNLTAVAPCFFVGNTASNIEKIVLEDCDFDVWYDFATGQNPVTAVWTYSLAKHFVVKNLKMTVRGAQVSGAYAVTGLYLNGPGRARIDIDGFLLRDETTARSSFATWPVSLGFQSGISGGNDFGGTIKRVIVTESVDTGIRCVRIANSTTLTLRKLLVEDCDFSKLSSDGSGFPLVFQTAGQNEAPVFVRNCKPRVDPPAELTFTPGATTVSAQYLGHYEGLMTITGGTVTLVEVSTDNSTFRTVAAGTNTSFYIDHGWYVRLTYSVTPTCKVIPRR